MFNDRVCRTCTRTCMKLVCLANPENLVTAEWIISAKLWYHRREPHPPTLRLARRKCRVRRCFASTACCSVARDGMVRIGSGEQHAGRVSCGVLRAGEARLVGHSARGSRRAGSVRFADSIFSSWQWYHWSSYQSAGRSVNVYWYLCTR